MQATPTQEDMEATQTSQEVHHFPFHHKYRNKEVIPVDIATAEDTRDFKAQG